MSRSPVGNQSPRRLPEALRDSYGVQQRQYGWLYAFVAFFLAVLILPLLISIGSWLVTVCVVVGAVAVAVAVVLFLYRGVDVELKEEEVLIYRGIGPRRHMFWDEVRAINVHDCWREEASIELAEEQDVLLRGVDERTARGLAAWFEALPPKRA